MSGEFKKPKKATTAALARVHQDLGGQPRLPHRSGGGMGDSAMGGGGGSAGENAIVSEQVLSQRLREAAERQRQLASHQQKKDLSEVRANVSSALAQALHSEDSALLDRILSSSSSSSANSAAELRLSSIERLNPALAVLLLRRCAEIFQSTTSRAQEVVPWIRDVLKVHSTFLMAQPEVPTLLAPVSHVIKEHLATYDRLRMLQGRLELLLSRIPHLDEVRIPMNALQTVTEEELQGLEGLGLSEGEGEGEEESDLTPDQLLQRHLRLHGSRAPPAAATNQPVSSGATGNEAEENGDEDDDDDDDDEDIEVNEDDED